MVLIRSFPLIFLIILPVVFVSGCTQAVIPIDERGTADSELEQADEATQGTITESTDDAAPVEERTIIPTEREGEPVQHKTTQAIIALVNEADYLVETEKPERAQASLERALRIDAKNPVIWHKLARLHLQQSEWQKALNMARKSNVLAQGDHNLQAENWRVIAHALKGLGNNDGASQAEKKARQLNQQ